MGVMRVEVGLHLGICKSLTSLLMSHAQDRGIVPS